MIFSWWQELQKDRDALALIRDWLGMGGNPVPREQAEARAKVCATCGLNGHESWWDKIKDRIAQTITRQLEIKNKIGLRTTQEDRLHMCEGCGCCLKLKVWVPLEHIRAHTTPDTIARFATPCWIVDELKGPP